MQPNLTVGILDNPLVVAAFLIASALIHWLTQRRQQQEKQRREAEGGAAGAPPAESDMEAKLRELFGEEPPLPAPPPVPDSPPLRPETGARSPAPLWKEAEAAAQTMPPSEGAEPPPREPRRTPPPQVKPPRVAKASWTNRPLHQDGATRAQRLNKQAQGPPAQNIDPQHRRQRRTGEPATLWRDRESARRAFVASLVFGAPKGLEP
jgi:hypothetical protein